MICDDEGTSFLVSMLMPDAEEAMVRALAICNPVSGCAVWMRQPAVAPKSAALAVVECFDPEIVGLNCATGPAEMNDAVRYLCANATRFVSVLPNAGLPQNEGGHAVYKLTPQDLAKWHRLFVTEYGVNVVGGCCGTTPEHLRAVVEALANSVAG